MQSCKATTREGKPCRAAAGEGGLCFLHANPDRVKDLGRAGGRKNGHLNVIEIDVPTRMTVNDLNELTSKTIKAVMNGDLKPSQADSVAKLLSLQRQNIASGELEDRIAALEEGSVRGRTRQEVMSEVGVDDDRNRKGCATTPVTTPTPEGGAVGFDSGKPTIAHQSIAHADGDGATASDDRNEEEAEIAIAGNSDLSDPMNYSSTFENEESEPDTRIRDKD